MIDYLELVSSFESQREYERTAPGFENVPYEVIMQWEDWMHKGEPLRDVYSPDEAEVLSEFWVAWEAASDAIPDDGPSLAFAQTLPEWGVMSDAATTALKVFAKRGRLPEDIEAP